MSVTAQTDQIPMQSHDFISENVQKIGSIFPHCVTETANGYAVDFDLLKQELQKDLVEGTKERYRMEWPGKRQAIVTANLPSTKTLRPVVEESMNFNDTQHIYIEGDNLEVLKLLQESYLGKIKVIYIDPPYNTGKDFIYKDDFTQDKEIFKEENAFVDEKKNRLRFNPDTSGRYHSNWITMMYSRLKLSRNLLKNDGVIFISIDDNEVHNLRKICDEIFGEKNFLATLIWKRRAPSALADNNVSTDHEYVLCFKKEESKGFKGIEKDFKNYSNPDSDPRGPWVMGDLTVGMTASMRPNQAYDLIDPISKNKFPYNPNRVWAYIPESMEKMIQEGRVIFPSDTSKRPMQKRFQSELKSNLNPFSSIMIDKVGLNTEATKSIQITLGGNVFDYSKPLSLLKLLLSQQSFSSDDIILDFFSGSATTAHATMQLNAEDGGNRKYIMVQLPETTDVQSEAYKAGFPNICELGKERIRRAAQKIKSETNAAIDYGFRVFKLDESNMQNVYYHPEEYQQSQLELYADNVKPDRTAEDLLFQVILNLGLPLSSKIEEHKIGGKKVLIVLPNILLACFDLNIDGNFVKEAAHFNVSKMVFKDGSFKDDTSKENVKQLLKQLNPNIEMRVI